MKPLSLLTAASLFAFSSNAIAGDCNLTNALLTGKWKLAPQDLSHIEKAIDEATDDMNFVIRGIARSRLESSNQADKSLDFSESEKSWLVSFEGKAPAPISKSNGTLNWTSSENEKLKVKGTSSSNKRSIEFIAEDGSKEITFQCLSENKLKSTIRVKSPKLPKDVVYSLIYEAE